MNSLFRERRKGTDRRVAPSRSSDQSVRLFKLRFALVALVLLVVNLSAGALTWMQQHRNTRFAVEIYDSAFVSANYIHKAELSFARFAAAARQQQPGIDDLLTATIDYLDVTIEHAPTPAMRAEREVVRGELVSLREPGADAAVVTDRLAQAERGLARLGVRAAAGGLKARDQILGFAYQSDLLLLALVVTCVGLAGTALFILRSGLIARMTYLANYDSLTQLPKRPLLHARLSECLLKVRAENGKFAVLGLDLDRFKRVNDTLGHHTGDLLLREVAKRISGLLQPDDVVARFGGDEFVILQANVHDPRDAGMLAERLVGALGAPYEINGQQILIGASVGIALAPENGKDVDDLLRNSDIALYQAKAAGKGRFLYFAAEMNATMQSRRVLELELREALEKQQLEVHFQPLVDVATGQIVACEALVRWNHRTRGYIPPIDFLPLAEETGLIVRLGNFVLRQACVEAASWTRDIRVAVNLSALQFGSNDLVALVTEVLAETGLAANRLDLEITETLLMEDKETVVKTLTTLRELGVRISLDDFGTGYSSLSYLSSFPFDKIKIDRSFVRDVANRSDAAAIIRAITGLAGTMGMTTIAEGVESVEELEWLRIQGCNEVQGFLFSKPIPSRDLQLLLGMAAGQRSDFAAANKQAA